MIDCMEALQTFPCDVCGGAEAEPIPVVPFYTGGQNLFTCRRCGFVYAHERRVDAAIKRDWAEKMFTDTGTFDVEETKGSSLTGYTGRIPAVIARLTYALENFDKEVGFADKRVCDIGAGEGEFLQMVRERKGPRSVYGVEPSLANGSILQRSGIPHFVGGAEEYAYTSDASGEPFDSVCLNWTLENTQDARRIMQIVFDLVPVGGYVQVATGSRILVPFRKPLNYYFNPRNPVDLHAFHFSANALQNLVRSTGFELVSINRFIDTDFLCVIGRKREAHAQACFEPDDYCSVIAFFDRWARETENFYRKL